MKHHLTFGKHEGKSFEWIFFRDPGYAQWIYENGIHRQEHHFDEEESCYFAELYRRATNLAGICAHCKERPASNMRLTYTHQHHDLLAVGFYYDECEYLGGSRRGYFAPSFCVDAYTLNRGDQKMIVREIVRHYMGAGNLTQKRMEEFFHNDANFFDCTTGYFLREEVNT